jgi:hypothetical protein
MDVQQAAQFVNILRSSQRLNLKDPAALVKAKKVLTMAKDLQSNPKYQPLPPELNAELTRFFDSVGARPEVAGIKTTVQGNKWESMNPILPPLGKKRNSY